MSSFIGVVTVLFNSEDVVLEFFKSLECQVESGDRMRVYVIDNSPTRACLDQCERLAQRFGVDAVFVFNNANLGVAAGNNQGIKLALKDGCSHILLANNDTVVPRMSVARLLASLTEHGAQAVSPKIYFHGEGRVLWYAGAPFNGWTMRAPHRGMDQPDIGQFDSIEMVQYAPTCFMLVDSEVFERIGLMDEKYFCYWDDTDFVYRLHQSGFRLLYDPRVTVDHKVSSSTGGQESPFTVFHMTRNRVYFARKNLSGLQRASALAFIVLSRLYRAINMPKPLAAKLRAGLRQGFEMALPPSVKDRGS